jgi:pyrroline-5-carboxylate reductase
VSTKVLPPVLLVGLGRMGSALLAGWQRGLAGRVLAVDPALPAPPTPGVPVLATAEAIAPDFRPAAVVLAVKPQQADAVLPHYRRFAGGSLFISIMAGRSIASLTRQVGEEAAVVRAMPNTPAAVGQGVTVACASARVSAEQRALAATLLGVTGAFAWVEEEAQLDVVTAVSGGGPAYVFLLAELLERAAREQGLDPALARLLGRQTVIGAGALLAAGDEDAAALRRAVTSPKGTTERALAVLMDAHAWPAQIMKAVAAATTRSRELAG